MFTNYRYVYTLYKMGSFTKAAEALYISQPALSAAIGSLEKALGAPLFERTGRGVRLTRIGKSYIAAAEQIMDLENGLKAQISDVNSLESGSITVGGSNYLSSYVLPKIINRFSSQHPGVEVTLQEANSCTLLELLEKDQVDVILDNVDNTGAYQCYPLIREQILLCVSRENPVNAALTAFQILPEHIYDGSWKPENTPIVPLKAFQRERFILLKPGNDMYDRAVHIFAAANICPAVAFRVDQLNIAFALCASGMGCSLITDTFFRHARFRDDVVLYSLGSECHRSLCLAHKKNKYCTKAVEAFIEAAKTDLCT